MNSPLILRFVILCTLIASLAVGFAASAGPVIVPPVMLLSPPAGVTVNDNTGLTWSNAVQPEKYLLRFVIASTGESFKVNVPLENCVDGNFCVLPISETGLFDRLSDGDTFTWRVLAKHKTFKVKSAANMQIADTVNAPDNLTPSNAAAISPIQNLTWNNSPANVSYVIVIKEIVIKAVVAKQTVQAAACGATCSVSPDFGGELPLFTPFQWFVRAKGMNGDRAKSAKQTFSLTDIASLR